MAATFRCNKLLALLRVLLSIAMEVTFLIRIPSIMHTQTRISCLRNVRERWVRTGGVILRYDSIQGGLYIR